MASCSSDDSDDDRAAVTSIPDETTTSTSTTEVRVPPVDVIPTDPALITEEYVENVLNALYEVSLEAVKAARTEGVVDQPAIEIAESIRTPDHALEAINGLIELASSGFLGYRADPGPTIADVQDVIAASGDCVFAEVVFDSSATLDNPAPPPPELRAFVELRPASDEQLASGLNPTAWVVSGLPTSLDDSIPATECTTDAPN